MGNQIDLVNETSAVRASRNYRHRRKAHIKTFRLFLDKDDFAFLKSLYEIEKPNTVGRLTLNRFILANIRPLAEKKQSPPI